jgi:signal transduction histidine kinase
MMNNLHFIRFSLYLFISIHGMRLRVETQNDNSSLISDLKQEEIRRLLRIIKGNNLEEMVDEDTQSFEDFVIQKLNDVYSFQLKQEQKSTQLLSTISHISKGDFTQRLNEPLVDKDNLDLIQKGIAKLGGTLQENLVKSNTFDVLFESINIPFLLFDVTTRQVNRINAAAQVFFNLDAFVNQKIPSYKLFDESFVAIIDSFYIFENDSFTFEYAFLNLKGKQTIIHISKVTNLFDSANQIAIFITDISVQKENELRTKERAIQERSLKLKQDFLTAIESETKKPLDTITHLLPSSKFQDFKVENIPNLVTASIQLKHAIDNITLYNTTVYNPAYTQLEQTSIIKFVEELLHAHYFHAIAKNVFLDYHIDKKIDCTYSVDQVKLKMIINNLIANALKFCKEDTIRLSIDLLDTNDTTSVLEFKVFDSYQGQERKSYFSINEIYNTNQNPTLSGVETAGLGMLVSIKLVEYLGGILKYDFIEKEGSYFTFQLRLEKALN